MCVPLLFLESISRESISRQHGIVPVINILVVRDDTRINHMLLLVLLL